jgi:methionyl-tRNA formyltransferase
LKIIFAGTPQFAADHLAALLNQTEHELVAVYTQPDRRSGRGKKTLASPVKILAQKNHIPVMQPASLKSVEQQAELKSFHADLMVVAAYGLILPQAVLDLPRLGCINIHASLLPHWRGAAPVERAIIAGDKESGITIMQMAAGLDTGDMLLKKPCSIDPLETGDSLRKKLTRIGQKLLLQAIVALKDGTALHTPQDDNESSYAKKIEKPEGCIDWQNNADVIDRTIRAFTSTTACFTFLQDQRLRITAAQACEDHHADTDIGQIVAIHNDYLSVQCGTGQLRIYELQIPGSKSMSVSALLNGRSNFFSVGDCFNPVASVTNH